MKEIAVAGIGSVSPGGLNCAELLENLLKSKSGIAKNVNSNIPVNYTALVNKQYSNTDLDRSISFAFDAISEAVDDSALDIQGIRTGIYLTSTKGGVSQIGPAWTADSFSNFLSETAVVKAARKFNIGGPARNISAACGSGIYALNAAVRDIEDGIIDIAIAGATEASITPLIVSGFKNAGVYASGLPRPYSKNRDGFVIGEGCGIVVLTREDKLKKEPFGYIGRRGLVTETAGSFIRFDWEGRAIASAIKKASQGKCIDYINLHGTATVNNDVSESNAIKMVFGENIPLLSSTKPITGHLLGASGALEIVITLLAINNNFVPQTLNFSQNDPNCDLNYNTDSVKKVEINRALSLSYGFGGHIGAIEIYG